jgi:hypothetical protein
VTEGAESPAGTARFGAAARNLLDLVSDSTIAGARACLESNYYAFNQRDIEVMCSVWSSQPTVQLNRPSGGSVRGPDAIKDEYQEIFARPDRMTLQLIDPIEYAGDQHAVFVGQEVCDYVAPDRSTRTLLFRATRYFRFSSVAGWKQLHYHGSRVAAG